MYCDIVTLVDKETKLMYSLIESHSGLIITPIYAEDGTIKKYEKVVSYE